MPARAGRTVPAHGALASRWSRGLLLCVALALAAAFATGPVSGSVLTFAIAGTQLFASQFSVPVLIQLAQGSRRIADFSGIDGPVAIRIQRGNQRISRAALFLGISGFILGFHNNG